LPGSVIDPRACCAASRNMSKTLAEYGTQKSTSITTARRLGEFLGLEMIQEKGITCKYIVAKVKARQPFH
jgi:DNA polymerase epsilon subunit 1